MASRLLAQGHEIDTLMLILGHGDIDACQPHLEISKPKLMLMFAMVL
ncbi:hypothetical protein [Massilia genomosp. 1]|nr:hypothetical protein [Massilia genomosp. 1]